MSNEVTVRFNGEASDRATLLLAAAEELDLEPTAVSTTDGAFVVPREVADKAGLDYESDGDEAEAPEPEKKAPAKKAAAKKSTAKNKE